MNCSGANVPVLEFLSADQDPIRAEQVLSNSEQFLHNVVFSFHQTTSSKVDMQLVDITS